MAAKKSSGGVKMPKSFAVKQSRGESGRPGTKRGGLSGRMSAGDRKAAVKAVKSAAKSSAAAAASGTGKRSKRLAARDYVNFDKMGQFVGYKKGVPKGYVYLPGSRYLSKTANLDLIDKYTSAEQRRFYQQNRSAVNRALEEASKNGAFRGIGGGLAADFDLAKGGKKFVNNMKEYFKGGHTAMHTPRVLTGYGRAGRRARAQWAFAFGQDGRMR